MAKKKWEDRLSTSHDPREACCPIMHYERIHEGVSMQILGTVFFISKMGMFITAKHVIEEYENSQDIPLRVVALKEPHYKLCKVLAIHKYPYFDIAVGMIDLRTDGWEPPSYRLSMRRLNPGHGVSAFGYSKTKQFIGNDTFHINLDPDFYEGTVTGYHDGGFGLARWPVYSHTMESLAGISGAPVICQRNSTVHGVACTGMDPPPGGTFSDIAVVMDEPVDFIGDNGGTILSLSRNRPDLISDIEY